MTTIPDPLNQQLSQTVETARNAVEQFGPKAFAIAVRYAQMDALAAILSGAVLGGIIVAIGVIFYRPSLKGNWIDGDEPTANLARGVISLIIMSFLFIVMCVNLFNPWNWIGLFQPDLYLVHKAIEALGNK